MGERRIDPRAGNDGDQREEARPQAVRQEPISGLPLTGAQRGDGSRHRESWSPGKTRPFGSVPGPRAWSLWSEAGSPFCSLVQPWASWGRVGLMLPMGREQVGRRTGRGGGLRPCGWSDLKVPVRKESRQAGRGPLGAARAGGLEPARVGQDPTGRTVLPVRFVL